MSGRKLKNIIFTDVFDFFRSIFQPIVLLERFVSSKDNKESFPTLQPNITRSPELKQGTRHDGKQCGKTFNKSSLKRFVSNIFLLESLSFFCRRHLLIPQNNGKTHECHCGSIFPLRSRLTAHQNKVHGLGTFVCPVRQLNMTN